MDRAFERSALDALEPRWRKMGYSLIREPTPDQLPAFLEHFRPDAIAVGPSPSLVIEVLDAHGRAAETKIDRVRKLLQGRDDWRLEVVYAPASSPVVASMSPEVIRETLIRLAPLAETEPRAALLMAWSTLEAVSRRLAPELAHHGLSSRSLVDLLIAYGYVPQSETARLLRLADQRNALAHGQLDAVPSTIDLDFLIRLIEGLSIGGDH
jgi:hypothetical protein